METISWEDRDGVRWIALEGELDHQACLDVRERFHEAVAGGERDAVVVIEGVTFLSSMAVGMLLKARAALHENGRVLRLSGVTKSVRRALEMMSLGNVFDEV